MLPRACGRAFTFQSRCHRFRRRTSGSVRPNNATKTIPIVITRTTDPVEEGLVDSFARPGGNITGLTSLSRDLSGKRLELLKEAVPNCPRRGSPRSGQSGQYIRAERGSPSRGACAEVDDSVLGNTRCGRF